MQTKQKTMDDLSTMVLLCSHKNASAQKQLYITYAPAMRSLCRKHVSDPDDAKDIFQEGFIKVFEKIDTLKNPKTFHSWMRQVFLNTAREYHRQKSSEKTLFPQSVEPHQELTNEALPHRSTYIDHVLDTLGTERLKSIIQGLEHPKNKIVPLYYFVKLSHAEISQILGITESNCKVHFHRAKHSLKKRILCEIH